MAAIAITGAALYPFSVGGGQPVQGQVVAVNGAAERYLRLLQISGRVAPGQWTVRQLGPRELDKLIRAEGAHPLAPLRGGRTDGDWLGGWSMSMQPAELHAGYNSGFPWGYNDGAVWAGRGLTTSLEGGVSLRAGPLTAALAPIWFWTENRPLAGATAGSGDEGSAAADFRDRYSPGSIDLPQRFGDGAYQQLDPGASTLRLDFPGIAVGVSTANQHWGPATAFPFLLGNNAAGFPHVFVGSSAPVDLRIAKVHGRIQWGRADQSEWSPLAGAESGGRRFISGIVGTLMPSFLPGFEIGGGRFFHLAWPDSGLTSRDFLRPVGGVLKNTVARQIGTDDGNEPDNQLASLFFRWSFPGSGLEVYGEYGREDHNADKYDLIVEPDHDAAYMVGLQKVLSASDRVLSAVRAEVLSTRINHLPPVRPQVLPYIHSPVAQGHTHRGQILGAPGGAGGGAFTLSYERHVRTRSWSAGVTRLLGCGGTGGTAGCDAMALELTDTYRRGPVALLAALSLVSRRTELGQRARESNVSLRSGLRWEGSR